MARFHIIAGASDRADWPAIRRIGIQDLREALAAGLADFWAMPTHVVFLALIYPLIGLVIGRITIGADALPLVLPLIGGFALIGPLAGLPLYELSRRREQGLSTTWPNALRALRSPAIGSIAALALLLAAIFLCWILTAQWLWTALMGPRAPDNIGSLFSVVFGTRQGLLLIVIGNAVGILFAALVFSLTVVSLPLLLDRDIGAGAAVLTSIRAVLANPGPMALWALIIAALLAAGFVPFFIGLALVVPILAHASWHLYRRVVVRGELEEDPKRTD